VRQAFFRLRTDREDLVRDRDAIQRALAAQSDTGTSLGASLAAIPAVREYAELTGTLELLTTKRGEARQMRLAFSSTYPPLRQLEAEILEIERVAIPRQAANLRQALDARIADLDARIAASSREMQQIPVRATEESRRERNRDVAQNLYREVQSAYESAQLAELSSAPDVRLLDYAVPPTRPVSDQVVLVIVVGFILGFGSGVTLAIVRDRFDPRLRYPEQVTRDLGLQILGALPLLRKGRDGQARPEDQEMLVEVARSIRMGLLFAHGSGGPFVVTISSPGTGDGKSFVSLLLAQSIALTGRRTLLIDGDNRRGHLHRTLGVERRPGLSEVLLGQSALAESIIRPEGENFDFLPTGTSKANIPELLSSTQMTRLMMDVRGNYEAIVIDSPPLGAGVDPIVLASLSGTLALVLRNGLTDRELASARLNDLRRLSIRVLGAVLNDVKPTGAYKYYSYLPGYGAGEQNEVSALPKPRISQPTPGDDEQAVS
jgi:tyrosine-protein kinase Etk/Wzc